MQKISAILRLSPSGASWCDTHGTPAPVPRFIVGVRAQLAIDLRAPLVPDVSDELPPYPIDELTADVATYYIALDGDYDHGTDPRLLRFDGITVAADAAGRTIVTAVLPPTAHSGLVAALAARASVTLHCEIGGLSSGGEKLFSFRSDLQIDNTVWNPDDGAEETPDEMSGELAASIRAYIATQLAELQGDKGDKGDKGDIGPAPGIAAGTVSAGTLGAEVVPATDEHGAEIPGSYLLNLTIPDTASPVIDIGAVAQGETPAASITLQDDGSYLLSLTLPRGLPGTGISPLSTAWSATTEYALRSAIRHNGAWWYSAQDGNTGHEPPASRVSDQWWTLIVQDGAPGVSPIFSYNPDAEHAAAQWHTPPYTSEDKWFRISTDDGATWGVPVPLTQSAVPVLYRFNPDASSAWAAVRSNSSYSFGTGRYLRIASTLHGYGDAVDAAGEEVGSGELRLQFAADADNPAWHAAFQAGDCVVRVFNAAGTVAKTYTLDLQGGEISAVELSPVADPWHDAMADTDFYYKLSIDGGATWSSPVKFRAVDGQSAYALWLAQGNSGTEAEFLASLAAAGAPDLSGYATAAALNEEAAARDAADSLLATAISGKAPSSHGHSISDVANLQNVLDAKIPSSAKGTPNGIATLGAGGKIPVEQLPEQEVGASMPPATITLPIPCDDENDNLILVVEFSATGTFDEDPPLRVSMEDDYAKMKVFSSGVWRTLDAGSVGVPDYGGSVAFQLDSTLLPGYAAGTRYYARYCWVDSRGGTDGWIGFAFAGDVADMRPVRAMEDDPAPVVHDLGGVSGALAFDYQDGEIQTASLAGNASLAASGIANLPPGGALLAYVTVTLGNALTVGNASFTKTGATYQVAVTNFGQIRMAVSELI